MREGYKETALGEIPVDWEVDDSESIAEITSSKRIHQSDYMQSGVPFFRGKEITQLAKNIELEDIVYITEEKFLELEQKFGAPSEGDILISAVGTIGSIYLVKAEDKFYFKDGNLMWLRNINGRLDGQFLTHYFRSNIFQRLIDIASGGSSQKALTIIKFKNLSVVIPPLPEQQKIAEILSTVDDKIDVIDQQISETHQLKKGLMQRLLTKGIGHTRFKDSKLGEVAVVNMGQSPSSASYNDKGIGSYLIQGNADIKDRKSFPRQWTSEPTKFCDVGDTLMTVRAPVGAIAKSEHHACIGRGVCSIKAKNINAMYLYQFLLSYESKWKSLEQGSTFTAVNGNDIKGVHIPHPPLPEQQKIAEILSSVDEKVEVLKEKKTYYQELKRGLMQQLLTGKIRVNALINKTIA
jgi:type I restriction enzyme, S subunit